VFKNKNMQSLDIEAHNQIFENATPQEILKWAWEIFGPDIAATSSFQSQSLPLLHLIAQTVPDLPVLFLDTGFHFPETLAFRDQLVREMGLNVVNLKPQTGHDEFKRRHGELYRQNPDMCCYINKVEPLKRAKKGLQAWITGVRRDQTATRAEMSFVSIDADGLYKICPMLNWTQKDVFRYMHENNLPDHPLLAQGYLSIGCAPCTRPVFGDGADERSGRWAGQDKVECGLHISIETKK